MVWVYHNFPFPQRVITSKLNYLNFQVLKRHSCPLRLASIIISKCTIGIFAANFLQWKEKYERKKYGEYGGGWEFWQLFLVVSFTGIYYTYQIFDNFNNYWWTLSFLVAVWLDCQNAIHNFFVVYVIYCLFGCLWVVVFYNCRR